MNNENIYSKLPSAPPVDYSWDVDPTTRRQIAIDLFKGDLILEDVEQLNLQEDTVVPSRLRQEIERYIGKHLHEQHLPADVSPSTAIENIFEAQGAIIMKLPWVSSKKVK